MKEDKLKRFVEENRGQFDLHQNDYDQMWDHIADELESKNRRNSFVWIRNVAASVLFLIVAGILFIKIGDPFLGPDSANKALPPEIMEATFYYERMIDEKLEVIQANEQEVDPGIFNDLKALDDAYEELLIDLKDNADNEEVIAAMIQNYKIKLEILESILNELNNAEDKNEESNESLSI